MTRGQRIWVDSPGWFIMKDLPGSRTPFVRNLCEAADMTTSTEVSVTWAQALAWRMERQLLDPVGTESVAGVVRRLGAVLSMDESLAELAVRTRRTRSRPGELAKALAEGKVIKAFAFRGSMHYLSPEDGGIYLALRSAGASGNCRAGWSTTGSLRSSRRPPR